MTNFGFLLLRKDISSLIKFFFWVCFLNAVPKAGLAQTQYTPSSYSYNTAPSGSYPDSSPPSELTDGTKSVTVWPGTANSASLAGWNNTNPSIKFIFSSGPVQINQINVWVADSDGSAGVGVPSSVTISAGGTSKTISVSNPAGSGTTVSLNLTGFFLYDDTISLTVNGNYPTYVWTMLSEVEFYGPSSGRLSITGTTDFFSDYTGTQISQQFTGTGSMNVLGTGKLNLGGSNSHSGNTTLPSQSYLRISSATALGTGSLSINGTNSGNGSTFDIYGNTISNNITTQFLNSGQTSDGPGCIQNTNTSTTAVLNGNWTLGGNNYVGGNGNLTLNGLISGGVSNSYSLYKQGSGIWKFTHDNNTFDGFYYQIGGTTEFTSIGNMNQNSSLGKPTTSTANQVAFGFSSSGGGTIRFVGSSANSSDRTFTVLGSTAITNKIEAAGTTSAATLSLSGNFSLGVAGSHNFALGGTNTGVNTFSGVIGNGSGTLSLIKEGVTTWSLTGSNTYSGTTTISAGTLQIGNGGTTGTLGTGNVINNSALSFNRSNAYSVSHNISGSGAVTQAGTGSTTLSGTNTYTGATTVSAGTLVVSSSLASSSGLTVAAGATIKGTGTLPPATINGTHAPGNSPGLQTVNGNLTYNNGAAITWELNTNAIGTRGTDYDGVDVVNGNLTFNSTVNLNLVFNASGSAVDWTNAFWSNAQTGSNGWKIFEVSSGYSISGLSNITINAASQWVDINSKVLRTQRVSNGTFVLEQVGTAVYLTYTPLPVSAFTISGINSVVQVNVAISGIQITAVDANGNTVTSFTNNTTYSGTAGITGTSGNFTSGVLATTLTPTSSGSSQTLIATNSTYSITGTSTFDVATSILTGSHTLDGTSGNNSNTNYYSTTGNLTLSQGFFVDYLIVAGGGGGGGDNGGGGGAGGMLTNVGGTKLSLSQQNYPVTVGKGGNGGVTNVGGSNGDNSSIFSLTATGGGGGAGGDGGAPPKTGGSGGGGDGETGKVGAAGTAGPPRQGYDGGKGSLGGGGGGGAGGAGSSATSTTGANGGIGLQNDITGTNIYYAGGGGGGPDNYVNTSSSGGQGGGGAGKLSLGDPGTNGLGGGGGGGGYGGSTGTGGNGGSGVVIVRYAGESVGNIGGTITEGTGTAVGHTLHTFSTIGSSTFTFSSVNLNDRLGYTLNQGISGSGTFTYSGPGRLILSANSTYTGNTTISGGILQIGNSSTTGSLGTGSITNNGTLSFQRSNEYTVPGLISGSGTVEQFGSGALNLGGLTTHQAGTWTLRSGTISNGTITSGNYSMLEGTVSATLGGTGTLTKTGSGTVTLSGNNTYSGTTTISAGTLIVNGMHSGSGAVTVGSGAVLKGTGTLTGNTTIQTGGTLEPGNNFGTMGFAGDLTLSAGGNLNWKIDDATGTAGTDWSTVNVTGAVIINATSGSKFNINVWSLLSNGSNGALANFSPTLNSYSWTIVSAGSISGFDANKFQINLDATNGTGGLISTYKANGFTIIQDANTLKLIYSPPLIQTIDGTNNGTETVSYTTNTSANSLTINQAFLADYLIVGGGGGGGGDNGGGGGAGGVLTNLGGNRLSINGGQNYTVTVGNGGSGGPVNVKGSNGGNSSVFGYTAIGGGGGGGGSGGQGPGTGGSGGGGDGETAANGASGTIGQGNQGGRGVGYDRAGGGGGGAGSAGANGQGSDGGDGGNGIQNAITGSSTYYAGGGGGGPANFSSLTSIGGLGGGGNGGPGSGTSGTSNTGSGGGGAGWNGSSANGGAGGSGIVIIRYEGSSLGSIGGTVSAGTGSATGYTLHTFTTAGSSSFNLSGVDMNDRLRAKLTGNVVGTGNLIYDGPGVLSLTGSNTYSGTTTISNGTLQVGDGGTTGSLGGGNITNNATLSFNRSDVVSFAKIISGTGAVTHAGSGTTTLNEANTYTGLTTVSAGTLQLNRTGGTTIPVTNNVTVSGGTLKVSTDQELNNLTVSSGGLVVDAGVTLTISGTYTGGGTITNNGSIIVKGSTTFPGSTSTVSAMNNLEINRAAGVTLNKDMVVTGALTLTSGLLDVGTTTLTVSGSIAGAASSRYIITSSTGGLRQSVSSSAVAFPIGNGGYNPVTITNNTGSADDFTARVVDEVYANGGSSGSLATLTRVKRTWDITKGTASANSGNGVNLDFSWDPANHTSGTLNIPKMYHYESGAWAKKSLYTNTTYDVVAGTLNFTEYKGSFSPFSVMDDGVALLPVTWLSFTAENSGQDALLKWATASEQNSKEFEIQHSPNGQTWNAVGTISAAGNSFVASQYQFVHQKPFNSSEHAYYRILQRDMDGNSSFSKMVVLQRMETETGVMVFPNPSKGEINIQLDEPQHVKVVNMAGAVVWQGDLKAGVSRVPSGQLATGVYLVVTAKKQYRLVIH
jgi:autotransporter-associated beta strand protein